MVVQCGWCRICEGGFGVWMEKESLPGMGRLLVCVADGFVRVTTLRASGRLR